MDTLIGSGRSPSPNKENTSDITHRLHGDDREQNKAVDPKVLQRVTLKIDFYLIPILGMFRVSFLPLVSSHLLPLIVLPLVQISWHPW